MTKSQIRHITATIAGEFRTFSAGSAGDESNPTAMATKFPPMFAPHVDVEMVVRRVAELVEKAKRNQAKKGGRAARR